MENEKLDIWMGKYIDGEISPAEKNMLDEQLAADETAREWFERFRRLHEQTRQVVREELTAGAAPMEEIFERAWNTASPKARFVRWNIGTEWIRFAAGLAAGLLIGTGLMWAAMTTRYPAIPIAGLDRPGETYPVASLHDNPILEAGMTPSPNPTLPMENRKIDWVMFPGPSGDQYLIEGYQRQRITPAMYYGDL